MPRDVIESQKVLILAWLPPKLYPQERTHVDRSGLWWTFCTGESEGVWGPRARFTTHRRRRTVGWLMPKLSSFYGMTVYMYYRDHAPPHFHASTPSPETMPRLTSVQALPTYRLSVEFDDGACGIVDLSEDLFGPMFEPLNDPEFFAKVQLDGRAPTWPNGADVAPDALYREVTAQ